MNCPHCGELLVRVDYQFEESQHRYHVSDTEWDKDNPPGLEDPGVLVPKNNTLPYPHCDKILKRQAADTIRKLVEYADAADPQLIDALQELARLCEANAPTSLIQSKLRTLASEVQSQDMAMADDIQHVVDELED